MSDDFDNTWGQVGRDWEHRKKPHGSAPTPQELRWGDKKVLPFVFTANGAQAIDVPQIVQIDTPAKVWAVHLALTMMNPLQMPAGDNVAVFFIITAGVGSSRIRFRRLLDNTTFVPAPVPGGLVQDVTDVVIPDLPAAQLLIEARVQYNNSHGVASLSVAIDACASPVTR